jgi:protein-disulfide isomerase
MSGVLFANAASLGKSAWVDLAREAGVANGQAFVNCMTDSSAMQAVHHDLAMGSKLPIRGTPTLLAAGKRYSGAISPFVLDSLIQSSIRHDQRD